MERRSVFYALTILSLPIMLLLTCASQKEAPAGEQKIDSLFSAPIAKGKVEYNEIKEASGLAASRRHSGMLWTHNDSGDEARIFLMTDNGKHAGEYFLEGVEALDVEDIAVGPGPVDGLSYIYLADFGDNWASRNVVQIYRFPEPDKLDSPARDTIRNVEIISYRYPDSPRDAETLMIDPLNGDLYIVSKREMQVGMYKLAYPHSTADTATAERLGFLPLTIIVAGDISGDGTEVLLKSYNEVYYWELEEGEGPESILNKDPLFLPYAVEPQGEAIAWSTDGSGYFTVSEEVLMFDAILYYYERR